MAERDSDSKPAPVKGDKQSSKVTANPDLDGSAQGDGASGSGKSAQSTDPSHSDRSSKNSGGSTSSRDAGEQHGGSSG